MILDLSTKIEFTWFLLFTFTLGLILFKVAISVASWLAVKSEPILLIWRIPLPAVKVNLSSVRVSIVPSALIKLYLSSSNGKNVSLSPDWTAHESSSADSLIVTLKVFLIVKLALSKLTSDIMLFGNGV